MPDGGRSRQTFASAARSASGPGIPASQVAVAGQGSANGIDDLLAPVKLRSARSPPMPAAADRAAIDVALSQHLALGLHSSHAASRSPCGRKLGLRSAPVTDHVFTGTQPFVGSAMADPPPPPRSAAPYPPRVMPCPSRGWRRRCYQRQYTHLQYSPPSPARPPVPLRSAG